MRDDGPSYAYLLGGMPQDDFRREPGTHPILPGERGHKSEGFVDRDLGVS